MRKIIPAGLQPEKIVQELSANRVTQDAQLRIRLNQVDLRHTYRGLRTYFCECQLEVLEIYRSGNGQPIHHNAMVHLGPDIALPKTPGLFSLEVDVQVEGNLDIILTSPVRREPDAALATPLIETEEEQ